MAKQQNDGTTAHSPCPQPARLMFTGERQAGATLVTITQGGQASRELPMHLAIRNHSPTGFEWGYGGSGPAQLALALCVEVVGRARAERSYQSVKDRLVATIAEDAWMLSGRTILEAVESAERFDRHAGGAA